MVELISGSLLELVQSVQVIPSVLHVMRTSLSWWHLEHFSMLYSFTITLLVISLVRVNFTDTSFVHEVFICTVHISLQTSGSQRLWSKCSYLIVFNRTITKGTNCRKGWNIDRLTSVSIGCILAYSLTETVINIDSLWPTDSVQCWNGTRTHYKASTHKYVDKSIYKNGIYSTDKMYPHGTALELQLKWTIETCHLENTVI